MVSCAGGHLGIGRSEICGDASVPHGILRVFFCRRYERRSKGVRKNHGVLRLRIKRKERELHGPGHEDDQTSVDKGTIPKERECVISIPSRGRVSDELLWAHVDVLEEKNIRHIRVGQDLKVAMDCLEFGIAQLIWTRLDDMLASRPLRYWFDLFVDVAELERERTRPWTLFRCVEYGLWAQSVGLTEDPKRCAFIAQWLEAGAR